MIEPVNASPRFATQELLDAALFWAADKEHRPDLRTPRTARSCGSGGSHGSLRGLWIRERTLHCLAHAPSIQQWHHGVTRQNSTEIFPTGVLSLVLSAGWAPSHGLPLAPTPHPFSRPFTADNCVPAWPTASPRFSCPSLCDWDLVSAGPDPLICTR